MNTQIDNGLESITTGEVLAFASYVYDNQETVDKRTMALCTLLLRREFFAVFSLLERYNTELIKTNEAYKTQSLAIENLLEKTGFR